MRVVGLDGGTRRVGVAVSDELGITAQPLGTLVRQPDKDKKMLEDLVVLLHDVRPDLVVVGLPLRLDGSEGGAARQARHLADLVQARLGVPVELWDERLTTVQAERVLKEAGVRREKRRGSVDRMAAAIMLQSYLDAHRRETEVEW